MTPALKVFCEKEKMIQYLKLMFGYSTNQSLQRKDCETRLLFGNEKGEFFAKDNTGHIEKISTVVTYIQDFFLKKAHVEKGFLVLHGAAVAKNDRAYVFLANTHIGKSTMVSFLLKNGFEYITDDRVIIKTSNLSITPFTKPVMLRQGAVELLNGYYNLNIPIKKIKYKGIERYFFIPSNCCSGNPVLANIYILNRTEGIPFSYERKTRDKLSQLMKYSLNINSLSSYSEFFQLSKIPITILNYTELSEVTDFLKEESKCCMQKQSQ